MDEHIRWLRRKILREIAVRSLVVWAIASLVTFTVLSFRTSAPLSTIAPWSLLAGQTVAALRLGFGLVSNPLNYGYLKRFAGHPYHFAATDEEGDAHPAAEPLADWNLQRVVSVRDEASDGSPVFDLFQTPSKHVTAAVGRASGSVTLVSKLDDGRLLLTNNLLVPPRKDLVVNTVPGGSARQMVEQHAVVMRRLADRNRHPLPADVSVFRDVMAIEHAAYHELGPLLGPFCNVDGARSVHRMMVRIPPEEILELALY